MNDGGSAFPVAYDNIAEHGMTLRDYFAAHAPPHPWHHFKAVLDVPEPDFDPDSSEIMEAWSAWSDYRSKERELQWPWYYADAMLAQREKTE